MRNRYGVRRQSKIPGFEGEADVAVGELGLPPDRAELLVAWAKREINLLDRRSFSRR